MRVCTCLCHKLHPFFACNEQVKDCISVWRALFTKHTPVWLVIFMGTNFREIGQNSDFRNFFAVLIFTISESGTRSDCFHYRPCAAVWIIHLCLRSILDYFSDSRHIRTQKHADARRQTQKNADKHRQTQTNADKRRRTQTNARQTASGVWADTTSRRIQTLDVCSRTFVTFGTYYTKLND